MWEDKSNLPFKDENIKYMWCKSSYPTSNDDLKLLPKNFKDRPISGYSDHSMESTLLYLRYQEGHPW